MTMNSIKIKAVGIFQVFLYSLLVLISLSCKDSAPDVIDPSSIKILFVGNSLTYTNNLPQLVKEYGLSKGRTINVEMLALPNFALVDHLANGEVQKLIQTKKFQFVVIQQGPSSQSEGRMLLFEAAETLNKLCTDNKARLAFYMVWPAYTDYQNFDGVIKNYTEAANTYNGILCPVGKAWKEYIDRTKDISYYGPDLFHPSVKGSRVAAEIIYNSIVK